MKRSVFVCVIPNEGKRARNEDREREKETSTLDITHLVNVEPKQTKNGVFLMLKRKKNYKRIFSRFFFLLFIHSSFSMNRKWNNNNKKIEYKNVEFAVRQKCICMYVCARYSSESIQQLHTKKRQLGINSDSRNNNKSLHSM